MNIREKDERNWIMDSYVRNLLPAPDLVMVIWYIWGIKNFHKILSGKLTG
jgi:hypothetical protein